MAHINLNKEKEIFDFETEELKGSLCPGGTYQGVRSLIHKKEGIERVGRFTRADGAYGIKNGDRLFVLDLYHYMAKNMKQGVIGRNMEYKFSYSDSMIKATLQPTADCFLNTQVVWEIKEPNIIDLTVMITANTEYQDIEVWLSSYLDSRKKGQPFIYVYKNPATAGKAHFIQPRENEFVKGFYLQFPRDNKGAALQYDGRWGNKDYATFVTGAYYAYPLFVSLNEKTGYAYLEMAEKNMCPRLGCSYAFQPEPIKGNDYSPLYIVLFGKDIKSGESMTASVRACVVEMGDDFTIPLKLYNEFIEEIK